VATVVNIDGELYKQRSPTGAWLLTVVTLLVYWFVWYYKINDEARRYLRDQSVKPWVAVLAIPSGRPRQHPNPRPDEPDRRKVQRSGWAQIQG
jgi:hypothetical protein